MNKIDFDFQTNQMILKSISFIDSFKGKWNIVESKENTFLKELRKIATIESTGSSTRIDITTEPHLVESEMNYLIEWTNEQITSKSLHPLIVIGLFIYEFLSIHPFQDGNGRLSRLLTNLLLLKNNYLFIQYVSFENVIEQRKKTYYEALMDGQKDRYSENERVDKWMLFFLQSLEALIHRLEQKYDVFKTKGGYLNDRQKKIKEFITSNQPIKLADLANSMPDISINTLKKDLQYMKAEQIIESLGKNKGTVYIMDV